MNKYVKLLRCHHYVKNILIFFPLFFSGHLFEFNYLAVAVLGFINFSLVSSIIYVINDIRDIDNDRRHETKRNRPLASGKVTIKQAYLLIVLIVFMLVILNVALKNYNLQNWAIVLLYFVLNIIYSYGLKKLPLIDVLILVIGFVLRVVYGSFITGIDISSWLYLTVTSFSFYFGLGKRRNELLKQNNTRDVLAHYNKDFLDKNMYMCLGLGIVFYSLWTVDIHYIQEILNVQLVYTVPFIIIISMKYSLIIESGSDGDPVEVVLNDKLLLGLILFYGAMLMTILYLI